VATAILCGETKDTEQKMSAVASLFPSATWRTVSPLALTGGSDQCLMPIARNGLEGFVPLSSVQSTVVCDSLQVIGLELYLTDRSLPDDRMAADAAVLENSANVKVVQVVIVNRSSGRLVGKLPGFPLESGGWSCRGDVCSTPSLIQIEACDKSAGIFCVRVARGSRKLLRYLQVGAGQITPVSDTLVWGDLGGESGCEAAISYNFSALGKGRYRLLRLSTCGGDGCGEICQSFSLRPGTDTTAIQLKIQGQ
jgi:hypothetical protein